MYAHIVAMLTVIIFPFFFHAWVSKKLDDFLAMRRIRKNIRRAQRLWYS